jgi:hypothetical protein
MASWSLKIARWTKHRQEHQRRIHTQLASTLTSSQAQFWHTTPSVALCLLLTKPVCIHFFHSHQTSLRQGFHLLKSAMAPTSRSFTVHGSSNSWRRKQNH